MTRKSEHPRVMSSGYSASGDAEFTITHPALPGWQINLDVGQTGTVERLQIEPRRRAGGPEDVVDEIYSKRGGVWTRIWRPDPTPSGGVTTRLLRQVPVGELLAVARQHVETSGTEAANRGDQSLVRWSKRFLAATRPGRRGRRDEEYLPLVLAYVDLVEHGDRAPVAMLAKRLHLSASQVRNLLHEARRRDLLTSTPRGRSGGTLTDKARQLKGASDGKHRQAND